MKSEFFDRNLLSDPGEGSAFLESIFEASTQYSLMGLDPDGVIQLWNEVARREYGHEPDEVIGKAFISILHTPEEEESR